MNLALRILGVAIFISAIAGATYGAFEAFDQEPTFTSVELTGPSDGPIQLLTGASTTVSIDVQNVGDTTQNLTFSTTTDGFSYKTRGAPVSVEAGATGTARGTLSVQKGTLGAQQVQVEAVQAGTDRVLGTVSFDVKVIEGQTGPLSLTANVPAVVPGQNVSLQGEISNPISAQQTFNFTIAGAEGTVKPAQATLQPNATNAVTVTAVVPEDASGTVQIELTAENEAGDTTSATASLPVLGAGEIAVDPVFSDVAVIPGSQYAVPILVVSNLDESADVSASGDNLVTTNFTTVEAGSTLGGFATFEVPADATGTLTQTITIAIGDQQKDVTVNVDTAPTGEEATEGKQVTVDYVGRLIDGTVFDSSVPEVAHGPFPKSSSFRARPGLQPIDVTLNPNRPGVIPGFFNGLVGMTEGESKTVVLPPTEAYGPVRNHENLSATTEIDRDSVVPRMPQQLQNLPIGQLPPAFDLANRTEGEIIEYQSPQDPSVVFKFELVRKGEDTADLKRYAEEGETTTFYSPWPNATAVDSVNETHIVYRTTPPTGIGNFTWDAQAGSPQAKWDNATTVHEMNETTIVLLHQPEEGSTYQASSSPRQPPKTYLVEGVTEENVHVSTPNSHPLAGETLVFDMTLRDVSEAPQPRMPPGMGGGR